MMREILLLCRLAWGNLLGLNVLRHTRDAREKRRWWLLTSAFVILVLTLFGYVGALAWGLIALGMGDILPAYLGMIVSLLLFFFNLFTAGSRLFAREGLDSLCAMPLRPTSIFLARLLCLYLGDLALTLLALLPGVAVYALLLQPGAGAWLALILGALVLPLLPLIAASTVGTCVMALSARSRHKQIAQTVLMLVFVLAVLIGSTFFTTTEGEITAEQLASLGKTVGELIAALYPPAAWFGCAVAAGDAAALLALVALSVGAAALFAGIAARCFLPVTRRLGVSTATHDYRMTAMAQRSLHSALYRREARRYFASSIYVTNTILAPILAVVFAVAMLVIGPDTVGEELALPIDSAALLPFVLAMILGMMPPSAVSISMEGKGIATLKAMPLAGGVLLDAKLRFTLSLLLPGWAVASVLLAIATRPQGLALLLTLLIPGISAVFTAVAAIAVDLRLHRFDWVSETAVVKQSASTFVGGFVGPLTAIAGAAAAVLLPGNAVGVGYCILLAAAAALIYRRLMQVELGRL